MKFLILVLSFLALSCGNKIDFQEANLKPTAELQLEDHFVVDQFTQEGEKQYHKVDILVIYDNSSSMSSVYNQLEINLYNFFDNLATTEWRLGALSTDYKSNKGTLDTFSNGKMYLTNEDVNYKKDFFSKITNYKSCVFCTAQLLERPLTTLEKAAGSSQNQDFFREDSELVVIFITNEDEGIFGKKVSDVISKMKTHFPETKKIHYNGIYVLPSDKECKEAQAQGSEYGKKLDKFLFKTNGKSYSICSSNYSRILSEMAQINIEYEVSKKEFQLQFPPHIPTLKVQIAPHDQTLKYDVVGDKIIFNHPPEYGTIIKVGYEPVPEKKEVLNDGVENREEETDEATESSELEEVPELASVVDELEADESEVAQFEAEEDDAFLNAESDFE